MANLKQVSNPLTPYEYGAVGDGVVDDTSAIQCAIDEAPLGGTVYLPPGDFLVSADNSEDDHWPALRINRSLHLKMDHDASIILAPNDFTRYAIIDIGGKSVEVSGGRIVGDLLGHIDDGGETGMGIYIWGQRVTIRDVYISNCWGDGILVAAEEGGGPTSPTEDIAILNCISDNNRRQGMSIVHVDRCQVIGGSYINTGVLAESEGTPTPAGPCLGIDIEPDAIPSAHTSVLNLAISDVATSGNLGGAIHVLGSSNGPIEATMTNCTSDGDCDPGVPPGAGAFGGNAGTFVGCIARNSNRSGFVSSESPDPGLSYHRPRWIGCTATNSDTYGFIAAAPAGKMIDGLEMIGCKSEENGLAGFHTNSNTSRVHMINCAAINNGNNTALGPTQSFDIYGTFHVLQSCYASAVSTNTSLQYNYVLRPEPGAPTVGHQLRDCLVGTPGSVGQFLDLSAGSSAFPTPGAPLPPAAYTTVTTASRTLPAAPSTQQVADVLGTVIGDLQALGMLQ